MMMVVVAAVDDTPIVGNTDPSSPFGVLLVLKVTLKSEHLLCQGHFCRGFFALR